MTADVTTAVDAALARAIVYHMLSVAFQPPTATRLDELGGPAGFPVVSSALRFLGRYPGGGGLHAAADRLRSEPVDDVGALAASYDRLFGHTARGQLCACETEYGADNAFHQPQQLADIAGYYLAFGLRPLPASEARVDHIACELEFMGFLGRKDARLSEDEHSRSPLDAETLDATRRAERTFLRDHLARFGRSVATRLLTEQTDGYFAAVGHVLLAMLDADCARLGVEGGPADLAVRPATVDDTPMACGPADELIQIRRRS